MTDEYPNKENINKDNLLISLIINKVTYTFSLPEYFIKNGFIPSLLIPNDIASTNINSKRDKYYIFIDDIRLEILCYRIYSDDGYTLYIPIYIIDNKEVDTKIYKYYFKDYYFYDHNYTFAYPIIIKNASKEEFKPYFIDKKRRHPKQIYEEAERQYLEDNIKSQRDVAENIKKEFGIARFDHSILSRSLQKTYIKDMGLNNEEVDSHFDPIYNFDGPRKCSFWDKKKLKAKFKYNYINNLILFDYVYNFCDLKMIINKEMVIKIVQLAGGRFFQLSLLCTNGPGDNPP
jgi:hypothetical protein